MKITASAALLVATASALKIAAPAKNAHVEQLARNYFSLGNVVKQQLGPTNEEDLRRELGERSAHFRPLHLVPPLHLFPSLHLFLASSESSRGPPPPTQRTTSSSSRR